MLEILENKKILIINSSSKARGLLMNSIVELSPKTAIASTNSTENALRKLSNESVDLILIDWDSLQSEVFQLIAQLKADALSAAIPILVCSKKRVEINSTEKVVKKGATDFLQNAKDSFDILMRIRSIIAQRNLYTKALFEKQQKYEAQIKEMMAVALHLKQVEVFDEKVQENLQTVINSNNPQNSNSSLLEELTKMDLNITDWDHFKIRFDAAQQGFLTRLSCQYPDLTRPQLTICSLLRLGLVSKEAAQVLNMTMSAMDKGRYRIRKKIDIPVHITLESFLMQV